MRRTAASVLRAPSLHRIRLTLFGLLGLAFATPSLAAAQAVPRAGWTLVPGGEDLITNGYWDINRRDQEPYSLSVSAGVLTVSAPIGYVGGNNVLAPRLHTNGDFGVIASFGPGNIVFSIQLTGSLNTGQLYWQGLTGISVGFDSSGNLSVSPFDGTTQGGTYKILKGGSGKPQTGPVTIELTRQQGQFSVYVNGLQYGPIPDTGLFPTGYVFPGFWLSPGNQITVNQLAFEAPVNDTSAYIEIPRGPVSSSLRGNSLGALASISGRTFGAGDLDAKELALGRYSPGIVGNTGGAPDLSFARTVVQQFNAITAATMQFSTVEPRQGVFRFGDGDAILAFAKANHMPVHCHNLLSNSVPDWLTNGSFSAEQIKQILTTHIQTVVGHFKGECASWDVVNEALNEDDGTVNIQTNFWGRALGASYVDLAFQLTHQTDPETKLFYNDHYIQDLTPKTIGLYSFISGLQQRGTPIDGVGLENHWTVGLSGPYSTPIYDQMITNMTTLAQMGLLVRFSEMDVGIQLPATESTLSQQASIFQTTIRTCLASPNCVSMTVWGVDDAVSWIPGDEPGYGAATLFDSSFQPKPAYDAVIAALSKNGTLAAPSLGGVAGVGGSVPPLTAFSPRALFSIYGEGFLPPGATGRRVSVQEYVNGGLPTVLLDVCVDVGGQRAPILDVFPTQINAQFPDVSGTSAEIRVLTNCGSANEATSGALAVPVVPASPEFLYFRANADGRDPVVLVNASTGTLVGPTNILGGAMSPARPGDILTAYGTGFGALLPPMQPGQIPTAMRPTAGPVSVTIGSLVLAASDILYAGAAPGQIIDQLNFRLPYGIPAGNQPIVLTVAGVASPPEAYIAVQQ